MSISLSEPSLVLLTPDDECQAVDASESGASFDPSATTEVDAGFNFDDQSSLKQGSDSEVELPSEVVIALSSERCYAIPLPLEQTKTLRSTKTLAYEMEEYVPHDGDDLATGKLESKEGWLVFATHATRLEPVLDQIDQQGSHVAAITPLVLLALENLLPVSQRSSWDFVVCPSDRGVDVLKLREGVISHWHWRPETDAIAEELIAGLDEDAVARVLILEDEGTFPEGWFTSNAWPERLDVQVERVNIQQAAADQAQCIIEGRRRAVVDLRNGALSPKKPLYAIRRPLFAAAIGLLICELTLIAAALFRDQANRDGCETMIARQEASFRKVFPSERIPVGITSRLQSEHRNLAGAKGLSGDQAPRLRSTLPALQKLLTALPDQDSVRFQLDRMEVFPDVVERLTGTTRSFEDLERISQRLEAAGFDVPRDSSSQVADGVTLRYESMRLVSEGEDS